jgi:hypothetical protein
MNGVFGTHKTAGPRWREGGGFSYRQSRRSKAVTANATVPDFQSVSRWMSFTPLSP